MVCQMLLLCMGTSASGRQQIRVNKMKILKSVLLVLTAASTPGLYAQDEGGRTAVLEEVTVTAQRRQESLQDAAIAINAATGSQLEQLGIYNSEGLNKIAPALTVVSGGGANTAYFIRGVGNFTNNGYTNPAVAFNIDGVYIGRPSSTISAFLDLNRVEVLKGPQGTLYGRNSTGGAINVIPNTPVLGENSGSAQLSVGNYSSYGFIGVGNFAIGENTAIRLAGTVAEHDGFFEDGTSDGDDVALRAQIYSEINQRFNVRVSADYSTQGGTGAGVQADGYYSFSPFSPDLPVPNWAWVPLPKDVGGNYTGLHKPATLDYIQENVAGAPIFTPWEGFVYPKRDDSYAGINAEINYDFEWAELTVEPAYRVSKLNNQFNGPPFKAAINKDTAKQTSVEARLAGETDKLEWILGAYYFDENVDGVNSFNQFGTLSDNSWKSDVESTAIFAQGTFKLTDQWRLVGGIRYTDESRSMDADATSTAAVCLEQPVGRPPFCPQIPTLPIGLTLDDTLSQLDPALFPLRSPFDEGPVVGVYPYGPLNYFAPEQFGPGALLIVTPSSVNQKQGDDQITYRLAVEYDLTPENLLYASFESGFRAGGYNLTIGRETYEPEYIDAFTLGSKNRFLDETLQVNIEVFYWKYDNQQLAALGLDTLGNNSFYTRNVGDSTNKGFEIDMQWAAADNTLLRGVVQYLDATYDKYSYTQVDLSDPEDPPYFLTPLNGCMNTQILFQGDNIIPYDPVLAGEPGYVRGFDVDCSGKPALNAPKWTMTAGLQQTFHLESATLVANVDARYRGARELGFAFTPEGRSDSDITLDATLTLLTGADQQWTITGFVYNLTDETIASTFQIGAGNVAASAYEPPRTYGVRVSYEF